MERPASAAPRRDDDGEDGTANAGGESPPEEDSADDGGSFDALCESLKNASFDDKRRLLEHHQVQHTYDALQVSLILDYFKDEDCTMSEALAIILQKALPMTCEEAKLVLAAAASDDDRLDLLQKVARLLTDSDFPEAVSSLEESFSSDGCRAAAREMLIRFEAGTVDGTFSPAYSDSQGEEAYEQSSTTGTVTAVDPDGHVSFLLVFSENAAEEEVQKTLDTKL